MTGKIPAEYHDEISECFRRHKDELYRFLYWQTRRDHYLAEDLVQHVMMEAAQNWETVRERHGDDRRSLLYVIAHRRAIDAFRRNAVTRSRTTQIPPDLPAPAGTDPAESVIAAEELDRFARCIDNLPPRQALVATLHWVCGWKNTQIAQAFGITPGGVTRRLDAARAAIRRELGPFPRHEVRAQEGGD